MRLILSRKGFDGSAGGCASPILSDGTLISLAIPDRYSPTAYDDIRCGSECMGRFVSDLTRRQIKPSRRAHLDPDLNRASLRRRAGWRPMFGQSGAARTHLQNSGGGVGDLFLFFGWFREVERHNGAYRFVPNAPDQHILFGWLYVHDVWDSPISTPPVWSQRHPHIGGRAAFLSTVYVAAPASPEAAGTFRSVHDDLVLTEPGRSRSNWLVPSFMHPKGRQSSLSYHGQRRFWRKTANGTRLRTVGRGQEFVLDGDHYPEAVAWAESLVQSEVRG